MTRFPQSTQSRAGERCILALCVTLTMLTFVGCAGRSILLRGDAMPDADATRVEAGIDGAVRFGGTCQNDGECASNFCVQGRCTLPCESYTDCFSGHGWRCAWQVGAQQRHACVCQPTGDERCDEIDNDCNGLVDDGTPCPLGSQCVGGRCSCSPGRRMCGAVCVDTASDPNNCGDCYRGCDRGTCDHGQCACRAGMTLCGDVCADLRSDQQNCGACRTPCPSGTLCIGGACGCFETSQTRCSGVCLSLQTDINHCGSCTRVCPSGASCVDGACQCPASRPDVCSGFCVDLATDRGRCGRCGNACSPGTSCIGGACVCPADRPDACPTTCTDLQTDPRNCGSCGTRCAAACFQGECISARSVAAGHDFLCVALTNGRVHCLGTGAAGQYGDGTFGTGSAVHVVAGLLDAVSVTAGDEFACALLTSGRVSCWGRNHEGQLGNGTTIESATPVDVRGPGDVVQLATGSAHVCARTSDGSLWCWGRNEAAQLGLGDPANRSAPERLALSAATDVAAGAAHTCAVLSGQPICWGSNDYGQLGRGTYTLRENPGPAVWTNPVASMSAGARHTCLLGRDGLVACWGDGTYGASGDVSEAFGVAVPTALGVVTVMTELRSGDSFNCASTGAAALCWGRGDSYQLGSGSFSRRTPVPQRVDGPTGLTGFSLDDDFACALDPAGRVLCWGRLPTGGSALAVTPTSIAF